MAYSSRVGSYHGGSSSSSSRGGYAHRNSVFFFRRNSHSNCNTDDVYGSDNCQYYGDDSSTGLIILFLVVILFCVTMCWLGQSANTTCNDGVPIRFGGGANSSEVPMWSRRANQGRVPIGSQFAKQVKEAKQSVLVSSTPTTKQAPNGTGISNGVPSCAERSFTAKYNIDYLKYDEVFHSVGHFSSSPLSETIDQPSSSHASTSNTIYRLSGKGHDSTNDTKGAFEITEGLWNANTGRCYWVEEAFIVATDAPRSRLVTGILQAMRAHDAPGLKPIYHLELLQGQWMSNNFANGRFLSFTVLLKAIEVMPSSSCANPLVGTSNDYVIMQEADTDNATANSNRGRMDGYSAPSIFVPPVMH